MYCHIHHCHCRHCKCVPIDSKEKGGALTQEELLALTQEMKEELKDYTVDLKDQIFSYIDIGVNPVEIANTFASLKEQDTYILRTLTNTIDELNNTTNLSMYNLRTRVIALEGQGATFINDLVVRTQRIEELETNSQVVESVAELATVENPKDGLRVFVKSYHAGLSKGGGYFTYDSSKSEIDDGGLVVKGWVREEANELNISDFGAIEQNTDNSDEIKKALSKAVIPEVSRGVYSVDETVPLTMLYGDGQLATPTGTRNVSPLRQLNIAPTCKSDKPLSAINPMGIVQEGGLLYVVTQGSYNITQQGKLDIFDISDTTKIKRISSINIGDIGSAPRALSVNGGYAYVREFGTSRVHIVDVSDPTAPTILATTSVQAGNSEHSIILSGMLIYTKLTGGIDFYDISNPLKLVYLRTLPLSGVLHRPTVDGYGFWVSSHNDGATENLFYVDCSGNVPVVTSRSQIPTLTYCRFIESRGSYLYAGGLDSTSRWNIIDVHDRNNPTVVYTSPDYMGRHIEVRGNLLFSNDYIYDITNPSHPLKVVELSHKIDKFKSTGTSLIGFGLATGDKGPAGNDGNSGLHVISIDYSGLVIAGADIHSLKSSVIDTDTLHASGRVSGAEVSAGDLGVNSTGPAVFSRVVNAEGYYQNGNNSASAKNHIQAPISTKTKIFNVKVYKSTFFNLKYMLVDNDQLAITASTRIGTVAWSTYITLAGAVHIKIPVTDVHAPLKSGVEMTLIVTTEKSLLEDGSIDVFVESPELSAPQAMSFFELEINSYGKPIIRKA